MLDHLSGGRMQIGLGRGAVWIEHEMYGVERARVPKRYEEARDVLLAALTSSFLDFHGEHFQFRRVEITMRPLQQPHPPLWYGIANPDSTVWTHTRSSVSANFFNSALPSSLARCARARVQAKIEAIEFVDVSSPFWCCL